MEACFNPAKTNLALEVRNLILVSFPLCSSITLPPSTSSILSADIDLLNVESLVVYSIEVGSIAIRLKHEMNRR